MNLIKALSRRTLFWIFFFLGMMGILTGALIYTAIEIITLRLSLVMEGGLSDYKALAADASHILDLIQLYYIPVTAGFFLLTALFLWICCRLSMASAVKKIAVSSPDTKGQVPKIKEDPEAIRQREIKEKRLFVHMMTVLQREGRFMDFLDEDLEAYDDEDVGAAVRTIHENCKKTIDKYFKVEPILSDEEDETITIESGFDLNEIKLVGNVTGEPPFKGVVRHRGWRAGKTDIPSLSGSSAPNIIAPAEVEVE